MMSLRVSKRASILTVLWLSAFTASWVSASVVSISVAWTALENRLNMACSTCGGRVFPAARVYIRMSTGEWLVVLCRHGETALNSSHRLQGRHSNPSLDDNGHIQANHLGAMLARYLETVPRFVMASSPLVRANQTAAHVRVHFMHSHKVNSSWVMDAFNEIDFGQENEGLSRSAAIASVRPTWVKWSHDAGDARAFPDAESLAQILERVQTGLHALFSKCQASVEGVIPGVVITHSGLLSIIMAAAVAHHPNSTHHWLSRPHEWGLDRETPHRIRNCDINALVFRYTLDANGQLIELNLSRVLMDDFVRPF